MSNWFLDADASSVQPTKTVAVRSLYKILVDDVHVFSIVTNCILDDLTKMAFLGSEVKVIDVHDASLWVWSCKDEALYKVEDDKKCPKHNCHPYLCGC